MADIILVFNQSNSAVDTIQDFYTSPLDGAGTKIRAFTASNDTTSSKTYKGYIFSSSGALVSAIIPQTIVVRDRSDIGPTIIDQVIPAGGSLRMETSAIGGINFYVTGFEQI